MSFVETGRMFYYNSVFQKSNRMAVWVCEISEKYMSSTTASFISFSKKLLFYPLSRNLTQAASVIKLNIACGPQMPKGYRSLSSTLRSDRK
jgi:hypothetical protein